MEEIEVKIPGIDKEKIVKRLIELGAKKVFDGPMRSWYLSPGNERINTSKMLRIRQKGDRYLVTMKLRKDDDDAKVSEEHEVEVNDLAEARNIFKHLGFVEHTTNARTRASYKLKNSLVEIDMQPGIPPNLEVESPTKDEMFEIVELLGFSRSQVCVGQG